VAKPPLQNDFIKLVDAFLLGFWNRNLMSNLKDLNTCYHNTCKCIVFFHFLHTRRVCFLRDF